MRRVFVAFSTIHAASTEEGSSSHNARIPRPGNAQILFSENPIGASPKIQLDLDLPNFIVTPHIAWASQEAMQILADQLIDNVEAFVAGEPRNVV